MQRCIKCNSVDGVIKSGFLRGSQRFYCKKCDFNFVLNNETIRPIKKSGQITIVDLAKHLGISVATVSRALNDKSDISPLTRKTVLEAANTLDYKPNLLAQSLNKGKTNTIGVVIPNVELPFFATALAKIQQVALGSGYRIIVCHSDESQEIEVLNTETLIACRVDGILLSHSKETNSFEHIKHVIDKGISIVNFDRVCNDIDTAKVIHEDFKGSFDLVEHLLEQGCRRIGIMLGPQKFYVSQIRFAGYKAALEKHGIELNNDYIVYSEMNKNDGSRVFDYFMSLPYPPDGIFAILSRNAIEMMVEAKKRKIKIPDEIAFVGFGDDLLAELFEPSLSVFNHFPTKVGEAAIRMLIDSINKGKDFLTYTQSIQGEMIIRDSSIKTNILK